MSIERKIKLPPNSIQPKRLGEILLEADLISRSQIEVALQDKFYYPDLYIGQILAMRNWIQQETADFFVQDWPELIKQTTRQPIGWYLQQAALLQEKEIEQILKEQKHIGSRFGQIAILQGHLKQTTLDFFLMYLFPTQLIVNSDKQKLHEDLNTNKNKQLSPLNLQQEWTEYYIEMSDEEIQWIS